MHRKKLRSNRKIRVPFYTLLFYLFLILQDGGIATAASLGSALLHELGHAGAALLLGVEVEQVTVYPFGADMRLSARLRSYGTDAAIAAAGAAVNLLLALAGMIFGHPLLVACNLFLAVVNLLPVQGLDGGVLLLTLMQKRGMSGGRALKTSSFVCLFFLWMIAVYVMMLSEGDPSLFVMACGLFISIFLRHREADG